MCQVEMCDSALLAASQVSSIAQENRDRLLSMVHQSCGGMKGDKKMMRYLRDHPEKYTIFESAEKYKNSVICDSLDICFDGHINGSVAMLFGRESRLLISVYCIVSRYFMRTS